MHLALESAEHCIERIKLRVAKGGHDVPAAKVRERYDRSLAQLPWFLQNADQAVIFSNSGAAPKLIGRKNLHRIELSSAAPPPVRQAIVASKVSMTEV
jgi:predicted ABC-type ATPase